MEKIICSLEEWDSILGVNRPNGASKTWYLKELGSLHFPLMFGEWNFFTESKELFSTNDFKLLIKPGYSDILEYVNKDEINGRNHLYLINVQNPSFFEINRNIGFSCVSSQYLDDVRKGKSKIILTMIFEGYSGMLNNFDFEIIEEWRKKSNLPEYSVCFITGNLLADEIPDKRGLKIIARGVHNFEPWNKYEGPIVNFEPKDDNYLFLSYNRQQRPHRVRFLLELLRKNLLNKGKVSFNKIDHLYGIPTTNEESNFIINNTPISIDPSINLHNNYAINLTKEDHEQTFISVVTETLTYSGTLFLSEKIWKPILLGHPFMVIGNKGTLEYLKSLGYKTFDKWVDESYDNDEDLNIRCIKITEELKKLELKSIEELKEIRNQMVEICQHNQNNFKILYNQTYNEHAYSRKIENIFKEMWNDIKNEK